MSEEFLIRTVGGPYPGTRIHPGPWPLPRELPDPRRRGKYVKKSESQMPPMPEGGHIMRGAEYEWVANGT